MVISKQYISLVLPLSLKPILELHSWNIFYRCVGNTVQAVAYVKWLYGDRVWRDIVKPSIQSLLIKQVKPFPAQMELRDH